MKTSPGPRTSRPHRGWHERGYLPHFDSDAAVQAITFRLADSLPQDAYDSILSSAKSDDDRFKRLEGLIDRGRGACILQRADAASIVENALSYFDGERYRLLAWVIMPNHVHVMIEQIDSHLLSEIIHSWKSFAAKQINRIRQMNGSVWAPDYHDRYIRNSWHYDLAVLIGANAVRIVRAGRPRSQ